MSSLCLFAIYTTSLGPFYLRAEEQAEKKDPLEFIFGEPVGSGMRILGIPEEAAADIEKSERSELSALSVVARNFADIDVSTNAKQRRITVDEWKQIQSNAQRLQRMAANLTSSTLDQENYLQTLSKLTAYYQRIPDFTSWAKSEIAEKEKRPNNSTSVMHYFANHLDQAKSGTTLGEKIQGMKNDLLLGSIFNEQHTPLKGILKKNPALWHQIPSEFSRLAGINSELSPEDASAFRIYITLLESAVTQGFLSSHPENAKLNVKDMSTTRRDDSYSQLSDIEKTDLIKLSKILAKDNKLSRTEIQIAFNDFIQFKKDEAQSTLPEEPSNKLSTAFFAYQEFVDRLNQREPSSIRINLEPAIQINTTLPHQGTPVPKK